MRALVFLGGVRITTALVAGLRRSGFRGRIVLHDRHAKKMRRMAREFGVTAEKNIARAVGAAGMMVVAVRPASVPRLLSEIKELLSREQRSPRRAGQLYIISLAAGVSLARLRNSLGAQARWTRAMPSPVCRSGRGLTALAFDRAVPPRVRREILRLFSRVGPVQVIPEKHFDGFTATYSSSHGIHALAALAAAAQKLGLPRKLALASAAHALADGIVAWRERPEPLAALLKEAATPGGIAATVMAAMDAQGYARIVERGLEAGVARARSPRRPSRPRRK
jgi:pyrroline-5-carboxylate reductase